MHLIFTLDGMHYLLNEFLKITKIFRYYCRFSCSIYLVIIISILVDIYLLSYKSHKKSLMSAFKDYFEILIQQ